jgi:hypothetical protein
MVCEFFVTDDQHYLDEVYAIALFVEQTKEYCKNYQNILDDNNFHGINYHNARVLTNFTNSLAQTVGSLFSHSYE